MRKTTWIQWLSLILVASPGAFADEWNKSFTVSGKADVRVEVTDGEVTVRAWDRNEINARVSTVGWTIGSSEVRVIEHQVGDRVEIDVRTPRMNIGFGTHSVRVEVEVPRELRAEIPYGRRQNLGTRAQGRDSLVHRRRQHRSVLDRGDLPGEDGRRPHSRRWALGPPGFGNQ